MKSADLDQIYLNTPLDRIPWNRERPPDLLVKLIESHVIQPCRAIDLGCGAGNYAVYLAKMGFDVTGVDLSPAAIQLAAANASRNQVQCRFLAADLVNDAPHFDEFFEFAFEWELLHHILPEDRETYMTNIARFLSPGALYVSLCFSEKSPQFGGEGKLRTTPIGTLLYFSSEQELEHLYHPWFEAMEMKTLSIPGARGEHLAVYSILKRRTQ